MNGEKTLYEMHGKKYESSWDDYRILCFHLIPIWGWSDPLSSILKSIKHPEINKASWNQ